MNKATFLLVFLLIIGIVIRWIILQSEAKIFAEGDKIIFSTRVLDSPNEENGLQRFYVTPKGYSRLRVIASVYPRFYYGQRLQFEGTVKSSTLQNGGIVYSLYFPSIEPVDDDNVLFGMTRFIRERVTQVFTSYLPPTSASLLLGIVFGVKEGIPKDFENALQTTGVFHVIAASGMNVSMLAGFIMAILSRLLQRKMAIIVSIFCIGFYTVLAGLEPSIIRASVMATIAFTALLLGRQGTALWSLTLTALLLLLFDPYLLGDIGFQLSFTATLGILLIKPLMSLLKSGKDNKESNTTLALLSEDLGSTISAQIATVPILLFYFHQYGLLSIPINALVLWMIPPLMIIGSVASVVALLFPVVASIIALFALPFLWLFETIVMASVPFNPVFRLEELTAFVITGYYLLLVSIVLQVHIRRKAKLQI